MKSATLLALLIGAFTRAVSAAMVFASFELLYAESYTPDTWKSDIASAKAAGIDGFALVGVPPNCQAEDLGWQSARANDAYDAAATQDFKIIPAFDMSYHFHTPNCPTGQGWNITYVSTVISEASKRPATYRWNDAVLITTREGGLYGEDFFSQTKGLLTRQNVNISIAPYLNTYVEAAHRFGDAQQSVKDAFSDYPSIDGFYNEFAWPADHQNLTCDVDNAFKGGISSSGRSGPYIMAVSPWYYQNLNTNNPADSRVQYSDTLWYYRWSGVINDTKPDIVNVLSWNSWNTSTYLRDLPQPNSTAPGCVSLGDQGNYVYGINHTAWREMGNYYTQYYKSGSQPEIKNNSIVYWYRVHRKNAACAGGQSSATGSVQNSNFPSDSVFIWAAVRADVEVEVYFGTEAHSRDMRPGSPKVSFSTANQKTPQIYELPFPDDFPLNSTDVLYPHVVVNPSRIAYSKYNSVPITAECSWVNYNPVVQSLGSDFDSIIG